MNQREVSELLAYIAVFDNRNIDKATVGAWSRLLSDCELEDAKAAVEHHFATSDRYLLPVHITTGVKDIRARRLADITELEPPDADPNDVPAYLAALRAGRRQTARPQTANIREMTWQPKGVPAS